MSNSIEVLHKYLKQKTEKQIKNDESLFENGLLDSMSVLDLVYHLEENLGIELDPDDITEDNFKTIDNIARLIEKKFQ